MIFDWLHTLDETATAVEVEKDKTSKEEKEEK